MLSVNEPQNQYAKGKTTDAKGRVLSDSICGKQLEEDNPQNAIWWLSEELEKGNVELNCCGVSSGGDEKVSE